jgi:predicted nucleic acid-binding protein
MIVVDTNVIAALYLPGDHTMRAENLLQQDPHWIAPTLWRSELRNVLALYIRKQLLTFDQAYNIQTEAESLLAGREYDVDSLEILRLAQTSGCSAYDCEFAALARRMTVKLITSDKQLLAAFPDNTIALNNIPTQ